jgi:hypothetical protein
MDYQLKEEQRKKIETIFSLVDQFKESYYNEKHDKKKVETEESPVASNTTPLAHQIITTEFRSMAKSVNVLVNTQKDDEPSLKWSSGDKQKTSNNLML